ncbi:hypothetical protein [Streptomyces sp. NPDC088746]|uniref:hypothetical protein n=1 Tax=Streptomyces sp. NPDC088746 TaxID=3365885 RepID=UPI00382ED5F5
MERQARVVRECPAHGGIVVRRERAHDVLTDVARRPDISVASVKARTGALFAEPAAGNRVRIALLVRDAEEDRVSPG